MLLLVNRVPKQVPIASTTQTCIHLTLEEDTCWHECMIVAGSKLARGEAVRGGSGCVHGGPGNCHQAALGGACAQHLPRPCGPHHPAITPAACPPHLHSGISLSLSLSLSYILPFTERILALYVPVPMVMKGEVNKCCNTVHQSYFAAEYAVRQCFPVDWSLAIPQAQH